MEKEILKTCGIFLYSELEKKFLIAKPTGQNHWTIPKGLQDEGESYLETAKREFSEETGKDIEMFDSYVCFPLLPKNYKNKKKRLYSFLFLIKKEISNIDWACCSLFENSKGERLPEIESFYFASFEELEIILHATQKELLEEIKEIINNNS